LVLRSRRILTATTAAVLLVTGLISVRLAQANGEHPSIRKSGVEGPSDPFAIGGGLYRAKTKISPISKIVRGEQVKKSDIILVCPAPGLERTRRLVYTVRAPISSWRCDEFCSDPALNGTFLATFNVDRREHKEPKRGCFTGSWKILNSLGVTVASGSLFGTVRAGTHDVLTDDDPFECEDCGEEFHFEGCMDGQAVAWANPRIGQPTCRGRICATFQGTGLDPDRLVSGSTVENPAFRMRIEGALFEPCPLIIFNPIQGSIDIPRPTAISED